MRVFNSSISEAMNPSSSKSESFSKSYVLSRQAVAAADEPQIRQNGDLDGPPTKKSKKNKSSSRLCSLPDDVLYIILGLLPVQEAVRTFIISKRWERLWMSMPVLGFSEGKFHDRRHFINFVDRVCAFHEPFPIQRFTLGCSVLQDGPVINAWITAAMMKGRVQFLNLGLFNFTKGNHLHKAVPLCIFSCETLVELSLWMHGVSLQLPADAASFFSLPRLKRLQLEKTGLPSGETLEKLVSSSPFLEHLTLRDCLFEEEENTNNDVQCRRMSLSAPCLREFLLFCTFPHIRQVCTIHPPISIHSASLDKFMYLGDLKNEVCICGPTTRLGVAAEITVNDSRPPPANVFKLLNAFSHVETLWLHCESIENFNSAQFPMFSNLIELNLSVFNSYDRMTMPMLRRCPRLESLTITGVVGDEPSHELLKLDDPVVPVCFQTHIKKIKLTNFWASDGDIECVGMLLQMSAVLETMVIQMMPEWMILECMMPEIPTNAQQILDKVTILPRKSKSCRISVQGHVALP